MAVFSFFLVFFGFSFNQKVYSLECSLYLAPSFIPHCGFGVFAGRDLLQDELIIADSTIVLDQFLLLDYQLSNYFYSAMNNNYGVGAFGPTVMVNHQERPNLNRVWINNGQEIDVQTIPLRPYTTYPQLGFQTKHEIKIGEELFTSYGSSTWFEERGIDYDPSIHSTRSYSLEELKTVGHCLNNVKISDSTIPMAGKGLFANRNFVKGELVTLSPVLSTPFHQIRKEGISSLMINYCMTTPGTDIAFLPIGYAGMANHGGKYSNLEYQWYDVEEWNQHITSNTSTSTKEEEMIRRRDKIFQSLNITSLVRAVSSQLYLGYYATRDIKQGEELTINYGTAWETAYLLYLDSIESWFNINKENNFNTNLLTAPQFRQSIQFSDWNFLPRHMYKSCVGTDCPSSNAPFQDQHQKLHAKLNGKSLNSQLNSRSIKESKRLLSRMKSVGDTSQTCSNGESWYDQLANKVKGLFGLPCH